MKRTIYSDFTSTVAGSTLPVLTTEEIEAIATDVSAAASDNVLTGSEKLRILIPRTYELSALTDTLVAAAAAAGVSFTALSTARTNYQNYLNGLSPAWDDTAASTTVVRTTLDNLLKVYMDAIADIQGKGTVANSLAQLDSTAATALSDIVNDAVLATTEKTSLMLEYNRAMSEWSILDTKAASLGGFSTQKAAAITAKDALITYLNSLTPAWNSPTVNTPIASPSTFRAKWADFYAAVAELDRVIRTNDFAYTTGATKPQDNATIGAPAGTLVAGVLAENIVSGLAAAVVIDTTAPSIPTGLALTSTYTQEPDGTYISTLKATWTASSATDLAGYILALKEGSGNFIEFPVGKGLSEFQIVAKSNVLYTAKIKAYDAQNNHSGFSSNVTHTTAKDTTAPSAPTSLSATSSFKNIFISWVNPSASDLSTIEVYENTTNNSTTAVIIANLNALPSGSGSFTRSGLGTGALRYYWLKAVDTSGNKSVFTSAVSATTIKAAAGELDDAIINSPSLFDATQVKPVKPLASLSTVGHANEDVGIYNGELYRMVSGAWTKSVQAPDITGQVVASQITDGAVSIAKFAAGITPIELLSSLPSVGNFNGRQVFLTTDKKTYRYDSTLGAFTAKTATSDLTGTITETQIDDNSISAPKIQANSVTAGKIAANTITAGQIQAGAIGTTELAADAVTASKIFVGDTSNKIPPLQDLSYWNTTNIGTGSGPYVLVNDSASGFGGSVRYYILSPSGATVSSGASTQYSPVGARLTPVEPGAKYLVSALNYIATGFTGWNTVWVVWYKADGTTATTTSFASGTDYRSSAASSILGSVPFSSTVIAPTDAAFAYIRLITFWSSTLTNAGQGIIAAPVFQRMASGELIVDGAITANKIATNTITANEIDTGAITSNELAANAVIAGKIQAGTIVANDIAANTITTDKLIVAAGNLVANSDFGANFANWRQWSTPSVQSIVSYNTANIRNALRFTYSGPGTAISSTIFAANKAYSDSGASDDGFAVEPGKSYRVAVETLRNAAFIGTLLVNAYFWMADGSYATSPITIFSTTQSGISSASWTKLTGSFTAPVGATRCWLYVVVESWTAGIVNISNLFCNQKSGGDLIVDGSITTNHITVNTINGDRITAGTLNADKIVAGTITGDKFNTGTSLPGTITVGSTGVDIGTVTSKAQNAPTGDVFIDSCDYSTLSQWNTNWNVIDNNGEFSTGTDSTVVGGKYVRFGNNSGNDTVWYYRKGEPIPFDPNCTYEMEVVCRRVRAQELCMRVFMV